MWHFTYITMGWCSVCCEWKFKIFCWREWEGGLQFVELCTSCSYADVVETPFV